MEHIRETTLINSIVRASRQVSLDSMATAEVCAPLLEYAISMFESAVADVWSVDPRQRRLVLVATRYAGHQCVDRKDVLSVENSLTGDVVETKRITHFDLAEVRRDSRSFQDESLRRFCSINSMLSVPILNSMNPHQVLCVVNFLHSGHPTEIFSDRRLRRLRTVQNVIASSIESNLRERSSRASTELGQQLAARGETAYELTTATATETLAHCCSKTFRASRVAIYLRDPVINSLRIYHLWQNGKRAFIKPGWRVPRMITEIMESNREILIPEFDKKHVRDDFFEDDFSALQECMLVPLQDLHGKCEGVVCCARPNHPSPKSRFSYDDIAILEATTQTFVAPLENVLESDRRRFAQQKLSHELRVPVTAFEAMINKMRVECRDQDFRFKHPHFNEGIIYVELMKRLLSEVDLDRFGPKEIPLKVEATHIQNSVVIPALRFTIPLLRERQIYARQFEYSGFEEFPELEVDPALITQVIFNLLDNAIKYFDGKPTEFTCSVRGERKRGGYEIIVSDNGPGLPEQGSDRLFGYGKRGANRRQNAFGEGLGLWISKEIAVRHRGNLFVRKPKNPTTLVLWLPSSVEKRKNSPLFRRRIQGL